MRILQTSKSHILQWIVKEKMVFTTRGVNIIGMCVFTGSQASKHVWSHFYANVDRIKKGEKKKSKPFLYHQFWMWTTTYIPPPSHHNSICHLRSSWEKKMISPKMKRIFRFLMQNRTLSIPSILSGENRTLKKKRRRGAFYSPWQVEDILMC